MGLQTPLLGTTEIHQKSQTLDKSKIPEIMIFVGHCKFSYCYSWFLTCGLQSVLRNQLMALLA